jgi:hypothetical protein
LEGLRGESVARKADPDRQQADRPTLRQAGANQLFAVWL